MSQDDYYDKLLKRHGLADRIPIRSTKREQGQKMNNEKYDELMRKNGLKPVKSGSVGWDDAVMNAGLQQYNLKRKLNKEYDGNADRFDVRELIDPTLHYSENLKELHKQGIGNSPEEYDPSDGEDMQEDFAVEEEYKAKGLQPEEVIKQRKAAKEAKDAEEKAKAKEKEDAEIRRLYSDINNLYSDEECTTFKGKENLTSIRVGKIFKGLVVEKLIGIMGDKAHFKQIDYACHLIIKYGLHHIIKKLEFFNIRKYYQTMEELGNCFNYHDIKYKNRFNIREGFLLGSSDEEYIFFCTKDQKNKVKHLCEKLKKYTNSKIYESDIVYMCIIYSLHSMFKDDVSVDGYENAHFYTSDELIINIKNYLQNYSVNVFGHFQNIKPKLLEEYEYKTYMPGVSRRNLELKDQALDMLDNLTPIDLLTF